MKFVMTQAVCPEGMQLLDGIADVYVADNQDPNNYLDEMRDAAALIVRIAKCDANAIENSPKLKVIGRTGVGYDSVDVKKGGAADTDTTLKGAFEELNGIKKVSDLKLESKAGKDVTKVTITCQNTGDMITVTTTLKSGSKAKNFSPITSK